MTGQLTTFEVAACDAEGVAVEEWQAVKFLHQDAMDRRTAAMRRAIIRRIYTDNQSELSMKDVADMVGHRWVTRVQRIVGRPAPDWRAIGPAKKPNRRKTIEQRFDRQLIERKRARREPLTLQETGFVLGISCEYVRQIEAQALAKIRRAWLASRGET